MSDFHVRDLNLRWERCPTEPGMAKPIMQGLRVNGIYLHMMAMEVYDEDNRDDGSTQWNSTNPELSENFKRLELLMGEGVSPTYLKGLSGMWVIYAVPEGV